MKLGIIVPPKAESFDRAKALGLDFVEFDCNPPDFSACLWQSSPLSRRS